MTQSDIERVRADINAERLHVTRFRCGNEELVLTPPLRLPVSYYLGGGYSVECGYLGLMAYSRRLADLIGEVEDQLAFLWRDYARANPNTLSEDAYGLYLSLHRWIAPACPDCAAPLRGHQRCYSTGGHPRTRPVEETEHLERQQAASLIAAMLACFSKFHFPAGGNNQPAIQNIPAPRRARRVRFMSALILDYEEIEQRAIRQKAGDQE